MSNEKRKMRLADQHGFNAVTGKHFVYKIEVPKDFEDWELEGLKKQSDWRKARAEKAKEKKLVDSSKNEPTTKDQ